MDFLFNPYFSHTALAALYTAVLGIMTFPFFGIYGPVVAMLVVSTFFYGREAGQREHDLKHMGVDRWLAWLGAEFMFRWDVSNLMQWLVAAGGSALVLALFWLLMVLDVLVF